MGGSWSQLLPSYNSSLPSDPALDPPYLRRCTPFQYCGSFASFHLELLLLGARAKMWG